MNSPIVDKQSQLNRSTRGQWHLYRSHREELERLLVPDKPGRRICALGAGNCNDLDLQWLLQVYSEVHLVDIDPDAMARGVEFQKVEGSSRLTLRGSFDMTSLAVRIGTWGKKPPAPEELATCTQIAGEPTNKLAAELNGPFDVVLSPCVLSQLLTPLRDTIGESHPGFAPLFAAMRARHFRLMLDLLAPAGRGVFACDLFSSAVLPDLSRVPKDRLSDVMRTMLARDKHFSGLDPASIASVIRRDPHIAPQIRNLKVSHPWLWHLGLNKTYLVYAMTFDKSATATVTASNQIVVPGKNGRL